MVKRIQRRVVFVEIVVGTKIPGGGGKTENNIYASYVALHEVTRCMVVWCTQNAPTWQQFHVAPAMPVHHFGG